MGAISHIVRNLPNTDEKLKRQTLCALSSCAKHSSEIAEVVVEAEIFPDVLIHLTHPSVNVKRNAACLIREIVKHSLELTQLVVNSGGIGALVEVVGHCDDDVKIPCVTALGFMAGHSEQLAMSELNCNLLISLVDILNQSNNDPLLCVTTWTLGQIGKHSPETSHTIAVTGIFDKLNQFTVDPRSSEDLKCKARNTLKLCLQKCMLLSSLEPLLFSADPNILKYVLGQYSKVSISSV
ncbi:unnamed protein product [Brassicogethes aeneus]|uniref:Uncharacterized protein n=1 Tax=Brassicogethes aeneus TaxID=1431903 RepID=A0A9P0FD91_BRAAE|nr:unnamed protein product [Brassicogethes aeneus]